MPSPSGSPQPCAAPTGRLLRGAARLVATAVALLVAFIAGGLVAFAPLPPLTPEEARQGGVALIAVVLADAVVLAYLASRARWHGWRFVAALSVIHFGVETFMSQIETWFFRSALQLSGAQLLNIVLAGLTRSVILAPLLMLIWGKRRPQPAPEPAPRLPLRSWALRSTGLALAYVAIYFLFGYFIAWQWEAARLFYSGTTDKLPFLDHMAQNLTQEWQLTAFQVLRGYLWVGLAALVAALAPRPVWHVVLTTALVFGVVLSVLVLFPNPFLPPAVRQAHFIELSTSMLLFGALAGWVLTRPPPGTTPGEEIGRQGG